MTSRTEILAETLARLEAERYMPVPPRPVVRYRPVSVEQGLANQRILLAALGGEVVHRNALCDRRFEGAARYDGATSEDGPDGALTPLPGPDPRCNSTNPRSEG